MIVKGDLVLALSASGETEEILRLLATLKRLGVPLISITCDTIYSLRKKSEGPRLSNLAQAADVALDCSIAKEACSLGLAPTASTAAMMALGDALAVALAERRGFKEEDFARLHPGGKLGKKLARVSELMHSGDAVPRVQPKTRMSDVIYEMSRKRLGVTTVVEKEKLIGIISDGDLRRLLERSTRNKRTQSVLELTASECMTRTPRTISPDEFATAALRIMEERRITCLPVVDDRGKLMGIVHLHDLWGTEML
jgi:arabinose-5-phosphate isomerase